MIGWSFVCDLACTLLCGPAIAGWMGGVPLVAPVTADCTCKVCECKGKCECKAAPTATPAVSSNCREMMYCPGQHGGRALPAATALMTTFPAPTPADAEKMYKVHVRLPGDGACPALSLPANTHSLVSMNRGEKTARAIHVHVQPIDEQTVRLNLKLSMPGKPGEPVQRLGCQSEVRLDTVTGVVLAGNGPEPYLAEVRVQSIIDQPVLPPATPVTPVVCPVTKPMNATWTAPVPPRATRVVAPAPVPMPAPMIWPAPSVTQAIMPEPLPTPTILPPAPLPPAAAPLRLVSASRPVQVTKVSLQRPVGEGKSHLHWKYPDGSTCGCGQIKYDAAGCGPMTFAPGKKYVHVRGEHWHAMADNVEIHNDGFLVLTGHVKVMCKKGCSTNTLAADRVAMKVKAGKIDKVLGGMLLSK